MRCPKCVVMFIHGKRVHVHVIHIWKWPSAGEGASVKVLTCGALTAVMVLLSYVGVCYSRSTDVRDGANSALSILADH